MATLMLHILSIRKLADFFFSILVYVIWIFVALRYTVGQVVTEEYILAPICSTRRWLAVISCHIYLDSLKIQ